MLPKVFLFVMVMIPNVKMDKKVVCGNEMFHPDPESCSRYYQCSNGVPYRHDCSPGLHWDTKVNTCNYPKAAKCTSDVKKPKDYVRVCYFIHWTGSRGEPGKFGIEDIQVNLCTHVVYAFSVLFFGGAQFSDDGDKMRKFVKFVKERDAKPILGFAGNYFRWSEAFSSEEKIKTAANMMRNITLKYGFQGMEINCLVKHQNNPQGISYHTQFVQKTNFLNLLKILHKKDPTLYISVAVDTGNFRSYEFDKQLNKYVDLFHVMSYDYILNHYSFRTNHIAPLRNSQQPMRNIKHTIDYYLNMGIPPKKLAVSYPAIARTFTLQNPKSNKVYAIINQNRPRGRPGRYTKMKGRLSYFEMCDNIKNDGWTKQNDIRGPYAYKDTQWATYYDVNSVIQLARFIKEKGLAGSVVWSINDDDFHGNCCKNRKFKSPLQFAMMNELKGNRDTVEDVLKSCPY